MASNIHLSKRVDLSALEHLNKRCNELGLDAEQLASAKQALETLSSVVGVSPHNRSDRYLYGFDASLKEMIVASSDVIGSNSAKGTGKEDIEQSSRFMKYLELVRSKGAFKDQVEGTPEYAQTMEKVKKTYIEKFEPKKPELSMEDAIKAADDLKQKGNERLSAQDFQGAISFYDQALETCPDGPNTHIFLSNRAAAYTHLKDYERAAADCSEAIALKPDFSKAHSRLAQANFQMGKMAEAKKCAERSLELDATNGVALAILEKIKSKESGNRGAPAAQNPMAGMPRGMPGMPPGGGGGMPDLAGLMNNPMMAQMMQDPAMQQMAQQMAQDPNAMSNLMGMMGGGGGGRGRGRG